MKTSYGSALYRWQLKADWAAVRHRQAILDQCIHSHSHSHSHSNFINSSKRQRQVTPNQETSTPGPAFRSLIGSSAGGPKFQSLRCIFLRSPSWIASGGLGICGLMLLCAGPLSLLPSLRHPTFGHWQGGRQVPTLVALECVLYHSEARITNGSQCLAGIKIFSWTTDNWLQTCTVGSYLHASHSVKSTRSHSQGLRTYLKHQFYSLQWMHAHMCTSCKPGTHTHMFSQSSLHSTSELILHVCMYVRSKEYRQGGTASSCTGQQRSPAFMAYSDCLYYTLGPSRQNQKACRFQN